MESRIARVVFCMSVLHTVFTDTNNDITFDKDNKDPTAKNPLTLSCTSKKYETSSLGIYMKYDKERLQRLNSSVNGTALVYHIESLKCMHMGTYICQHNKNPDLYSSQTVKVGGCAPRLCPGETQKKSFSCDKKEEVFILCIISSNAFDLREVLHKLPVGDLPIISNTSRYQVSVNPQMPQGLYYNVVVWIHDITHRDCGIFTLKFQDIYEKTLNYYLELSTSKTTTTTTTISTTSTTEEAPSTITTPEYVNSTTNTTIKNEIPANTSVVELSPNSTEDKGIADWGKPENSTPSTSATANNITPYVVLIVLVIIVVFVSVVLGIVVLKLRGALFKFRGRISRHDNSRRENGLQEDHHYENLQSCRKVEPLYRTAPGEPNEGREITKDGLIYVTIDHRPVPGKKKKKRDKRKREKPVVYASLDYNKSGKFTIRELIGRNNIDCCDHENEEKTGGKRRFRDRQKNKW